MDAASREETMFLRCDDLGSWFTDIGAGIGGGAAGCVLGGGAGLLISRHPAGAILGCKIGTPIGGAVSAGSMEYYNQQQRVQEHSAEIEQARRAGISFVQAKEAKGYRNMAYVSVGLNAAFGALTAGVGARFIEGGVQRFIGKGVAAGVTGAVAVGATEGSAPQTATGLARFGQAIIKMPNGTKAMYVGGSLVGLDYFGIDEASLEPNFDAEGKPCTLPSLNVEWGPDYHVDTAFGIAGALLLGGGATKRLVESPVFRGKFFDFLFSKKMGAWPNPVKDIKAPFEQPYFLRRVGLGSGVLKMTPEGAMRWIAPQDLSSLSGWWYLTRNASITAIRPLTYVGGILGKQISQTVGWMEYPSVPFFLGDFTYQQFTTDEAWMETHGIDKTPQLSIVGGMALALAAGNRLPIKAFGLPPDAQRSYFLTDRGLDMYTMYSSGNAGQANGKSFWQQFYDTIVEEPDWFRIAAKYASGWSVGQVRGNWLRYELARAGRNNTLLKSFGIASNGFKSATRNMADLTTQERDLVHKLLEYHSRFSCELRVNREGKILNGTRVVAELNAQEKQALVRLFVNSSKGELSLVDLGKQYGFVSPLQLTRPRTIGSQLTADEQEQMLSYLLMNGRKNGGKAPPTYASLFEHQSDNVAKIVVDPKLNALGLAAFAGLHDTVIGTSYDYFRGEYLIFGDGQGYAMWTFLRSLSILPLRTALKANIGWHSNAAVIFDFVPRMLIDPYFTNWTRIYAKSGLWWPYIDSTLAKTDDTQGFQDFFTGSHDNFAANGVDSWNRNHWPLSYATRPNDREPVVDTFADGYRVLTQKVAGGSLKPEQMEQFDTLLAALIGEVRTDLSDESRWNENTQTKIEHSEVLAAMAYVVHLKNPRLFSKTFSEHGAWIDTVLGPTKPVTADDVARLATEFGENTTFGAQTEITEVPFFGGFFSEVDGRSKGYRVDLADGRQLPVLLTEQPNAEQTP